ncbi:MAG: hypothetical protein DWQ36_19360 [Acidobacteria bacterium]|nr:MAG: hypothetical protein DWQ30_06280 [Acidobacteriota bacterium]REK03702.1 MAG: hypothetical protein DWQ36_19360 [Acidobacteriota bacterium]
MAYPGNPSIAAETQKRILTTFTQTLDLARQGRIQEAALGCDFVLKMDPLFEPASDLQLRLSGADGPVEVEDLAVSTDSAPSPTAKSSPSPASTVMIGRDDPAMEALRRAAATPSQGPRQPGSARTPPAPEASEDQTVFDLDLGSADDPFGEAADGPLLPQRPATGPSSTASSAPTGPSGDLFGASHSPEAGGRIEELLTEGRRQLAAGEHQAAIDAWSRIFLIDIDHEEANRLIEDARQQKAEQERALEEQYHEGIDALEQGDLATARQRLEKVLELNPGHMGAREHLDQLSRRASGEAPPAPAGGEALPSLDMPEDDEAAPDLPEVYSDEPADAPAPAPVRAAGTAKAPTVGRPFLLIGIGVLGLVLLGGYFLWTNWDNLFPNAEEVAEAPRRRARVDRLQEANRLYLAGDIAGAIDAASKIPAIADEHAEAQQLIARWKQEQDQQVPVEEVVPASEEELEGQRQQLLETARRAYGERQFYRAARNFQAASRIAPLDSSASDLFADARAQLRPIEQQLRMFRDGEYERLLAPLWRMRVDDEQNVDVRNLLVDSYFNLGVRALRAGDPEEALGHLREIAELDPDDPVAARLMRFAEAYAGINSRDLLYDIFVRGVEVRSLADRG